MEAGDNKTLNEALEQTTLSQSSLSKGLKSSQKKPTAILTEPQFKKLAHLPLLTVFYFSLQRELSSTPVTALELAAYLDLDLKVTEALLAYLEKKGVVRSFRENIPAYCLNQELKEITAHDLIEMLGEYHHVLESSGVEPSHSERVASDGKYRKIYSDLASEMLQLFGEESANDLPV